MMNRPLLLLLPFLLLGTIKVAGQAGPCAGIQVISATPPPSGNGTYFSGTVVTFCYSITDYAQTQADWLCGVVPVLGPGWDPATLQPVSPAVSCDGQGVWGWYPSCTGTASGLTFGPGFYYDSPAGSTTGTLDGIPGNNFGDNCQSNTWTFCFSVQVAPCPVAPNGTDLTVEVFAYSDYTVGSWGNDACIDPPATQIAEVFCNCTLIVPTVNVTNATCQNTNDGSITVIPQGVAPYTFLWSTGATTATINNLAPGIYTVTVTDSTLCDKMVTIPVGGPQPILSNATLVPNGCDTTGGSISLAPSGGNGGPFTFLWSNGSTGSAITNLTGGTYTVTITDSLNCAETDTFTINTVVPVSLSTSSTIATCLGNDGSATVVASGGTPPYTFLWSDGSTAATAANIPAGTYTVTVTDSQGCTSQTSVTVPSVPGVTVSAGTDTTSCSGQPVTLNAATSGGTAPFTFTWDNGASGASNTVSPTVTTIYTVTVTDINSCTSTAQVTVNVIDFPVITLSPDANICFGAGTQLQASGGNIYSWSPSTGLNDAGIANPFANPTVTTTYVVTVSNGPCSSTASVTITVEPEIVAAFSPDTTQGQAPLTVNFSNNTTGAASYSWNFGDGNTSAAQSPAHTYTSQGNYTVTMVATNVLGCTDTVRYEFIIVDELSTLIVPNVFTPNGDGFNDTFSFEETGITSIEVKILNRWGNEVYSWSELNSGWDGKSGDGTELPDGVYLYIIKARGINDKSFDYQGTVQLIRTGK